MRSGRLPSAMSHTFSRAPQAKIQRSVFNRSHVHKTTFDSYALVPIYLDEVLPGDTFNLKMSAFARLATPIVPFMDNMYLDSFFFFVPMRLLWDNWEKFNGAQTNPGDSTDFVIPTVEVTGISTVASSLASYFGIPLISDGLKVSALPFRAYRLICNEYFRDQNLQNSLSISTGDSGDTFATLNSLQYRNKRYDYFTSCLPWPQKGPSAPLPLGQTAPLVNVRGGAPIFHLDSGSSSVTGVSLKGAPDATGINPAYWDKPVQTDPHTAVWEDPKLEVDLSKATSATINQLRQAFQIQKLLERDARGGTRYFEILQSHFHIYPSPDARLQRPEYLGGGTSPVNINPVAQTSSTDSISPQGNLSAFGTVSLHNHGFTKSFVEHGYIIGLVSIRTELTYQDGLNRLWSRSTRYDFYWPALAHIGEQAVLNKEICAHTSEKDKWDQVFGYQERYAEYRYKPSLITSSFNSSRTKYKLDQWHLSQYFPSTPSLNRAFINGRSLISVVDRVLAVTSDLGPQFLFDSWFKLHCARPMPTYSVPGLVDHF